MAINPEHDQIPPELTSPRSTEIEDALLQESIAKKAEEASRREKEQIDLTTQVFNEMSHILFEAANKIVDLVDRTKMTVTQGTLMEVAYHLYTISELGDARWDPNAQRRYYFAGLLSQADLTIDSLIEEATEERAHQTQGKRTERIDRRSIEKLFRFNVEGGWTDKKRLDHDWREAFQLVLSRQLGAQYADILNFVFFPEDELPEHEGPASEGAPR